MRHTAFEPVPGAPLLVVDDVRTTFDTPAGMVHAVDGVSLRVDPGRTLGLVGESGSGKSVLVRSILNLVMARSAIQDGSVRYRGVELRGLSTREMTHIWGPEVAMVFQDPMTSLNPTLKIGDQLKESLWYHLGLRGAELRATATALLRSVGIPEPERRMRDYPHEMSGGMRQRVTIAIALGCGPKLLVADEPTTALDVTVQKQILDLLKRQQSQREMGMILVTHDFGVVAGRTDEIAVMYAGRLVERAPTREIFRDRKHPYTDALLRSIPRMADPPHTKLHVVPGRPPDLMDLPAGCPFAPRCAFARDRCHEEAPVITSASPGHEYSCFYPLGSDHTMAVAAS